MFTYTEENLKEVHDLLDCNHHNLEKVFEIVMRGDGFSSEQKSKPWFILEIIQRWSFLSRGLHGGRDFKTVLKVRSENSRDIFKIGS